MTAHDSSSVFPAIQDVDGASFESQVVVASRERPVLVDFWASWCGPCRTLTPVLEKIVASHDGDLVLAKVDSDRNPDLAGRFGVRGLPTVLLFRDGEPVDRFVGALPEREVRDFLRRHLPSEAEQLAASGLEQLAQGDLGNAEIAFRRAAELDKGCHAATLGLARIALARGDLDQISDRVRPIPPGADEYDQAQGLLEVADLIREAVTRPADGGQRSEVEAALAAGGHSLADGHYRDALEHFLSVVRLDREWNRQAGRRAMLTVFKLVGVRDPLADEYRDKLRGYFY